MPFSRIFISPSVSFPFLLSVNITIPRRLFVPSYSLFMFFVLVSHKPLCLRYFQQRQIDHEGGHFILCDQVMILIN